MSKGPGESPKEEGVGQARGFTLIEVLLALVITAILLAGIYNLFGSQEKSQVLVDQMAEMNQDLRVAATMITRDVRMAGYHLENAQATSGTGGGNPINAINITDGTSNAPDTIELLYGDPTVQTTSTDQMNNPSDELEVANVCAAGAGSAAEECGDGGQRRCFCGDDLILITDGTNSSIFCVTGVEESPAKIGHTEGEDLCGRYNKAIGHGTFPGYGSGSRVMKLKRKVYTIDRSDPNHPVLRVTEGTGENGAQPLVDYIEDLQVNPTTPNERAYTMTLTARTRKPLPGIGGIRRKSITETVRVRNIP